MTGCHGYAVMALLLAMGTTTWSWPIASGGGKLLVLLLDGVRWDFMQQPGLDFPGFRRLASRGVRAEKMLPTFPSSSYPNYYSIMTGVYCEDHGMVGNYMYDAERNESFLIGTNPEQFHANWWDDADPLWVTAARQGKKTVMFHWPGCEVEIRGFRPDYCAHYNSALGLEDFRLALNQSLAALANGSADFAGVYYEKPDKMGHKYGPHSPEVNEAMVEIDQSVTALLDAMDAAGLTKTVDVIIVSDHGMTETPSPRQAVNITTMMGPEDYVVMMGYGPYSSIWPAPGKLDQLYERLKTLYGVGVYRKEEIPARWRYGRHKLVAPLFLAADAGWFIFTPQQPDFHTYLGWHGYVTSHPDMATIFFASGPSFQQNRIVPAFVNVELYQVMCRILGVQPALHSGQWEHVEGMMASGASRPEFPDVSQHSLRFFLVNFLISLLVWL